MHNFLLYLLKSTLCISLLYLLFRTIMRKESFFALNRILLLTIVVASAIIPLLYLPKSYQPPVQVGLLPVFAPIETSPVALPVLESTEVGQVQVPETSISAKQSSNMIFTLQQLIQYGYFAGFFITLLFFIYSLITILLLFLKSKSVKMEGYRLVIIDREIAAFSFGRFVVLSQSDFEEHRHAMLAHEQAHIRLYHFFDLLLLETIRIFHWFNPFIHWLIRDMKEIHEFQADDYTLTKGIDEIQYKLLIIQKGVGPQMFALANSFNRCQIKKRLVMMNKQKPSKAWSWKVATFLPLLALLLMAFGRKSENVPQEQNMFPAEVFTNLQDSLKQWNEAAFGMDKISNWVRSGKLMSSPLVWHGGCRIIIDSKSQLRLDKVIHPLTDMPDYIRKYLDYDFANDKMKSDFKAIMINGQEKRMPRYFFVIQRDDSTSQKDYQKLLNTIGNTILEIRDKYAKEIFKSPYSKLVLTQRDEIDMLVPALANFIKSPILRSETVPNKNTTSVSVIQGDYSDKNRLPDSSTRAINADSVKESQINQLYFNENIEFQADKIALDSLKRSTLYLYKNVKVKFQDIKLLADYVELNKDSFLIYATGKADSTGSITGKPILTIGEDEVNAEGIRYNLKTRKGVTYGITTTK